MSNVVKMGGTHSHFTNSTQTNPAATAVVVTRAGMIFPAIPLVVWAEAGSME